MHLRDPSQDRLCPSSKLAPTPLPIVTRTDKPILIPNLPFQITASSLPDRSPHQSAQHSPPMTTLTPLYLRLLTPQTEIFLIEMTFSMRIRPQRLLQVRIDSQPPNSNLSTSLPIPLLLNPLVLDPPNSCPTFLMISPSVALLKLFKALVVLRRTTFHLTVLPISPRVIHRSKVPTTELALKRAKHSYLDIRSKHQRSLKNHLQIRHAKSRCCVQCKCAICHSSSTF